MMENVSTLNEPVHNSAARLRFPRNLHMIAHEVGKRLSAVQDSTSSA